MYVFPKQASRALTCLISLVCFSGCMFAEHSESAKASHSASALRVRHILGFPGVSRNATGDLSIRDHALRFQISHAFLAQISVSSIQGLTVCEEDKQVGGVPMMLVKAAAPYESGRVISLFSHKKYDTVTLSFLDSDGAFHGAIFQLNKGQGQVLESELSSEGAHIARSEDESALSSTQERKK